MLAVLARGLVGAVEALGLFCISRGAAARTTCADAPELVLPAFESAETLPDALPDALVPRPALPLAGAGSVAVVDDWLVVALWFIVDEVLVSVELWLALTPLDTVWSPDEPTFTPVLGLVCAYAGLNAASTAAAATLSKRFLRFMQVSFRLMKNGASQVACLHAVGKIPTGRGVTPFPFV